MLSDEIKKLEEENNDLKFKIECLKNQIKFLFNHAKQYENLCKSMIPNQVYTHKERRNTTVKFLDGSQQTVKRRKGEKDCIETAVAYCVLKQLLPASDLKKLIEEREEH